MQFSSPPCEYLLVLTSTSVAADLAYLGMGEGRNSMDQCSGAGCGSLPRVLGDRGSTSDPVAFVPPELRVS